MIRKVEELFPIVGGHVVSAGANMKTDGSACGLIERRHGGVVDHVAPLDGFALIVFSPQI